MPLQFETHSIFPINIRSAMVDINPRPMLDAVYDHLDRDEYFIGKGTGGYQINHVFDDPAFEGLKDIWNSIVEGALEIDAWSVVARKGDHSTLIVHDHLPWHLSAIYYLKVPDLKGNEGALVLHDPQNSKGRKYIRPREGMMILFPTYLKHHVSLFSCEGDRISVSMNALVKQIYG